MMLELHREAKSHFIFSTVSVLQQKIGKVGKIWAVDVRY